MSEYIDREALGVGFCNPDVFDDKGYAKGWNAAIDIIKKAPAADVRPTVTAEWIEEDDGYNGVYYSCSNCNDGVCTIEGDVVDQGWNFCPSCGARMTGIRRLERGEDEE